METLFMDNNWAATRTQMDQMLELERAQHRLHRQSITGHVRLYRLMLGLALLATLLLLPAIT